MKKIAVFLLIVMFSLSCCSEEAPDGSVHRAYRPIFEEEALRGFQYVLYPEKSGLLLSAYSDSIEITVTAEENEEAENADAFLESYIEGIKRYALLMNTPEIIPWTNGIGAEGAMSDITYKSLKATEDDGEYASDAFCVKLSEHMYLLIVFNTWDEQGKTDIDNVEERFFESFRMEETEVSDVFTAFLKNAGMDGRGNVTVKLDFCSVVYDASIFAVYAQNETEKTDEYVLSDNTLIWAPDPDASLYTQRLLAPEPDLLIETAAVYYEAMGFDIIFQVLFDANGEIVWMMHYNAF